MGPLPGAKEFVEWVSNHFQLVILSDTFYEFAHPLMKQLGWPTIFCHKLETDENGMITAYKLRQPDQKRESVKALHGLNFRVIAAGDSYNDTTMLGEADHGFLFDAPANVIAEFPQFPAINGYDALKKQSVLFHSAIFRLKKEQMDNKKALIAPFLLDDFET